MLKVLNGVRVVLQTVVAGAYVVEHLFHVGAILFGRFTVDFVGVREVFYGVFVLLQMKVAVADVVQKIGQIQLATVAQVLVLLVGARVVVHGALVVFELKIAFAHVVVGNDQRVHVHYVLGGGFGVDVDDFEVVFESFGELAQRVKILAYMFSE